MKKFIINLFLTTLFVGSFCSCNEKEPFVRLPDKEETKEEVAEYYIKYVANSLDRYISITGVTVTTDNGTQSFNYSNSARKTWEQTYGPVKKGFRASINVKGNKIGDVKIYCCRGSEPFALKASRSGSGQLQYTINY